MDSSPYSHSMARIQHPEMALHFSTSDTSHHSPLQSVNCSSISSPTQNFTLPLHGTPDVECRVGSQPIIFPQTLARMHNCDNQLKHDFSYPVSPHAISPFFPGPHDIHTSYMEQFLNNSEWTADLMALSACLPAEHPDTPSDNSNTQPGFLRRNSSHSSISTASTTSVQNSTPVAPKEKRFPCPECDKRFARAFNLQTHIGTHQGIRPFECPAPECIKAFSRRHDLSRHLHAIHDRWLTSKGLTAAQVVAPLKARYDHRYVKPLKAQVGSGTHFKQSNTTGWAPQKGWRTVWSPNQNHDLQSGNKTLRR